MKCPLCNSSKIELIKVKYASFRHIDYAVTGQSTCIGKCMICQLLFNNVNENDKGKIDNIFKSNTYSSSKQTSHTLTVKEHKKPVTRSFLQAELLYGLLGSTNPSILDIGCFNGELLAELDKRFDSAELNGFDVNEHLRSVFPTKDNFYFWFANLENVRGEFDLICMSHSLQYVKDISHLIKQIKRLIKPEGFLFVQVPDIMENSYAILYGDQHYYYTLNILKNIFRHFGFEFSSLKNSCFPRELLGIARPVSGLVNNEYLEDSQIYRCIEYLDDIARKLNKILEASRVGILGTTINAAFVNSVLNNKVDFFVDENPDKVDSLFYNKKVIHPDSLDESDLTVIPYGETGHKINERFTNKYRGRFVCV